MDTSKMEIVIIGVGKMGSSIAASAAVAGHPVTLIGRSPEKAEAGVEKAKDCIAQLGQSTLIDTAKAESAASRLSGEIDLKAACRKAAFIMEAVPEVLSTKQKVFRKIEGYIDKETVIASTTSGMKITDIASGLSHPERAVTAHFWLPGHLVPLVEIVLGERTAETAARFAYNLLESWGKTPVIVRKELPGQLANRIQQAVIREAVNLVAEGVASAEDVDKAIKASFGIRFPVWGPLEHIDAVGLDLCTSVQRDVLPSLDNRPVPEYLNNLIANNNLGHKTGKGMYDWKDKDMESAAKLRDDFIMHTLKFLKNRNNKDN